MDEAAPGQTGSAEHYTYDIGPEDPMSAAIVYAAADALDCDPLAMPELLYDAVNVDALDAMYPRDGHKHSDNPSVSFRYCDLSVTVDGDTVVLDATTIVDQSDG
ncbi:HalOD1 output domain-containing protein [Halomarina salina]|uniref:HalOD1 output domain-containing protein n=1 Tax=Halomarina salina TaxID=1872699 RepID=A0ABD5RLL2_9EURY|nr:HalOD1 output domain-containing protein [Halomarina salina]